MTTLELIDLLEPVKESPSRVESIRFMYMEYKLTQAQKEAIESFLFEPTKEHALKAMDTTPKAWLFIRPVVNDEEIVARLSEQIEQGKLKVRYTNVLSTNNCLKDLLDQLLESPCASKLKQIIIRQQKKAEIIKKLKR